MSIAAVVPEPFADIAPAPIATAPPRLSGSRLLAFAAPALPLSALTIPMLAYIPTYYATQAGLSLAAIGTIFLLVRLFDIMLDPVIGAVMDRGHSRFGRFRPWLVGGTVPLCIGVVMLFNPPAGASMTYLLLWLTVCYVAYSACYLAHMSWGATLSSDYAGRSRVFAWWQAGVLLGMIAVLATPIIVEAGFGGSQRAGIAAMGWLVAGLLPIGVLLAIVSVPEPAGARQHDQPSAVEYLRLMIQPTIARLLLADLVIGTAMGMNSALFFFYFGLVKQVPLLGITVLLFVNLCGSLCGTPIWNDLTGRIGKHRAAAIAFVLYAVSLLVIAAAPAGGVVGMIVLFLAGLTLSAGPLLLRSMMADAGDEEYLRSGFDRTGLISALFAGTSKLGLALAPGITFLGLGMAHFNPVGQNSPAALLTLTGFYVAVPACLGIVTTIIIAGHKLTAERHAEICRKLSAVEFK